MKISFTIIMLLLCRMCFGAIPELSIFAGRKTEIPIKLIHLKGQPFNWTLKFKHRTIDDGNGIVDVNGKAVIELKIPAVKPGVIMNTVLKVGEQVIRKVRIYYPNPFKDAVLSSQLLLWDAENESPIKEFLLQFKLPYETTYSLASGHSENIQLIFGIDLENQPGIPEKMLKACRKGGTIICFLPEKTSVTFPGAGIKNITIEKNTYGSEHKLQFEQKGSLTISNSPADEGCNGIMVAVPPGKIFFYPVCRIATMQNLPSELYSFANILISNRKKEKKDEKDVNF